MKHLFSILLCLVLLASTFAFAETTENTVSKLCTIDDIVVTIDNEEFALPVVGKIAAAYSDDSIFFDFGLDYEADTLFPIQAKFASDGISLCIGNSGTAYVFDAALFDESIPYTELLEYFRKQLNAESHPTFIDEATAKEMQNIITETLCTNPEETSYQNSPAVSNAGVLDSAETYDLLERLFTTGFPNFFDSMNEYSTLQKTFYSYQAIGLHDFDESEEIDSFAQLLSKMGFEITSCDYAIISAESGAGTADFCLALHAPETGLDCMIPLNITRSESGETRFSTGFTFAGESYTGEISCEGSIRTNAFDVKLTICDSGNLLYVLTYAFSDKGDDAFADSLEFNLTAEDYFYSLDLSRDSAADGSTAAQFEMSVGEGTDSENNVSVIGIQLGLTIEDAAFDDRISGANEKRISTEDELYDAASMLHMRLMSLAGDVEKLMNDPTITSLAEAIAQSTTAETVPVEPETYTADDMPFEIPEFTCLPEGYSLAAENYYVYSDGTGSAYLTFAADKEPVAASDDEIYYYENYIYIIINNYDENESHYTLDADGTLTKSEGISITEGATITTASFEHDGVSYTISFCVDDFSVEDVVNFINGIYWLN